MIIEYLSFSVPVAAQAAFLAADAAIWTPALATSSGFLGKEVWRERDMPDRLGLAIRWRAQADWDAMDAGMLAATQAAFVAAMGVEYPVLGCVAYQVVQ
jgi:uncharacterized protein (TIGR03792 family)